MPGPRVFQKEVPEPERVTPEQREAWAQGAAWLESSLTHPDYVSASGTIAEDEESERRTGVEHPEEALTVAKSLSNSIGAPKDPEVNPWKIVASLQDQLAEEKERNEKLMDFLDKYQGKDIEGTGFSIYGLTTMGSIILIILLGVFCPGVLFVALKVIWSLRKTVQGIASGVESMADVSPEVVAKIKDVISKNLNRDEKAIVKREKKYMPDRKGEVVTNAG